MKAKRKSAEREIFPLDDESRIKEENIILKETVELMQRELESYRRSPFIVADVKSIIDGNAVIKLSNGNIFYVAFPPNLSIKAGDTVIVEQKNLSIIKKIPSSREFGVENFVIIEKPKISWSDVGGLEEQANELREVIEAPLKNPEIFRKIGITPPKGILLYGPPGTGKTLLAKAVASSTNATFIEIVSSELVQKFIGEGAKLVREIFELAKQKAPSIIFIDELDALASVRIDIGTSGEREVQRTFMQLLAEIDGFKPLGNVKIIGCTNRADLLDPAILRPGRLDRKIEIPNPNAKGRREILAIHTRNMNSRALNIDELVRITLGFSGA
ncbi:MAG: AAA family ATPase, partial [Candidatus Woesearchaeota archaeon]|nr:AAA family ATPase [Candidatus Woesearchaeota archaeon]